MSKRVPDKRERRRKLTIWASILSLAGAFWWLGDVKRNFWITDSPDGRFSITLVAARGWRSIDLRSQSQLYVTDNQTGESVLATTQPEYCVFEQITLDHIQWAKNSQRFTCYWAVQYNGLHHQHFSLKKEPLQVKASAPCCVGVRSLVASLYFQAWDSLT